MAKRAIEKRARDLGVEKIEEDLVHSSSKKMRMKKDVDTND